MSGKIIVSSGALYQYLSINIQFWRGDAKVKAHDHELQIDGFRYLGCEIKEPFEMEVPVEKLRKLMDLLSKIEDQPLTLKFNGHFFMEVQHILI
jgi:hypothetical protein